MLFRSIRVRRGGINRICKLSRKLTNHLQPSALVLSWFRSCPASFWVRAGLVFILLSLTTLTASKGAYKHGDSLRDISRGDGLASSPSGRDPHESPCGSGYVQNRDRELVPGHLQWTVCDPGAYLLVPLLIYLTGHLAIPFREDARKLRDGRWGG